MSKPDTWMPLVIGDYLADTGHLSTAEHGAYLLLLMTAWMRGGALPDDDAQLARITRASSREWRTLRASLAPFFHVADGEWRQKRLLQELALASEKAAKASARAESASVAKWGNTSAERGRELRAERMAAARQKGTHTAAEWGLMREFHGDACVRCGADDAELVRDHIVPVYQGGSDGIDNIQPLCRSCNSSKGPDATDHRKPGWRAFLDASSAGNDPPLDASPPPTPTSSLRSEVQRLARKATPIPDDFAISERVRQWADRKGFAHLERYFEIFVGRYRANGKTYSDWDQTFMNAIREDWYGVRAAPKEGRASVAAAIFGDAHGKRSDDAIDGTAERVA